GRIWGYVVGGLLRIDEPTAQHPKFTVYTMSDGLMSYAVTRIIEDTTGQLYLATNRGIDRLNPETGKFHHYTTVDGIANTDFTSAFCDQGGTLWFGTGKGLLRLTPETDHQSLPPPVLISAVHVAGVRQPRLMVRFRSQSQKPFPGTEP